jgi:hypothetical protein
MKESQTLSDGHKEVEPTNHDDCEYCNGMDKAVTEYRGMMICQFCLQDKMEDVNYEFKPMMIKTL